MPHFQAVLPALGSIPGNIWPLFPENPQTDSSSLQQGWLPPSHLCSAPGWSWQLRPPDLPGLFLLHQALDSLTLSLPFSSPDARPSSEVIPVPSGISSYYVSFIKITFTYEIPSLGERGMVLVHYLGRLLLITHPDGSPSVLPCSRGISKT